ncbi:MAG: hypothetical protein MJY85_10910 [Fibrobacter sp.]|nr:hypothetical protein [Fibrobacter sp.]
MTGISLWTILGAIIVLVALVVLFFPFVFRIEFRADLFGANAKIYLFKKVLYDAKKKFKVGSDKEDDLDDADFAPTYVPPKKKTEPKVEAKVEPKAGAAAEPKALTAAEPVPAVETKVVTAAEPVVEPAAKVEVSSSAPRPSSEKIAAEPSEKKSKEKPKLTGIEFWTIILTPEFDRSAFWAVKKLVASLLHLFRIKFNDCYVEGLRGSYENMGYGAALNGILKSFPFVGAWDLRMDWTRDHELCAQGEIQGSINVFRIFGVVFTALFYGGIVAFKFWRRRARVLKTHELPELGWIRSKIVKALAEED